MLISIIPLLIIVFVVILVSIRNLLASHQEKLHKILRSSEREFREKNMKLASCVAQLPKEKNIKKQTVERLRLGIYHLQQIELTDQSWISEENRVVKLLAKMKKEIKKKNIIRSNKLPKEIDRIQSGIQLAKKHYNQQAVAYNQTLEFFPANVVAKVLNYKEKETFQIESKL